MNEQKNYMEQVREFLIQQGIDPAELDEFIEVPVIRDVGEGLALSLMNDEMIGMDIVMLFGIIGGLEGYIAGLEERIAVLEKAGEA